MFTFVDHFENCINALALSTKQLVYIMKNPGTWIVSRNKRHSIEAHTKNIRVIRNAAEHMAEDIRCDQLKDGQPVILSITNSGDGVNLAQYQMKFSDVAHALRSLHQVGFDLIESLAIRKKGTDK